jgi:tellurite methyltransferase
MIRTIDRFRQDADGEWVADLSCLHSQHVRHRPPFSDRPWVLTEAGRSRRVGTAIACPLCDRGELPQGLTRVRSAGPFDEETLPPALQRDHRVAERTWAVLRVIEGAVRFTMTTDPPLDRVVTAGQQQAIPPGVLHAVHLDAPARLEIDFLVPGDA